MTPVDSAFRPMLPSAFPDGVSVHTFFTGLNHTARPLAAYASDTRSPSHPQDSLPAVPSALAGQDWLPAGFQFEVSAHGFLLNQTWAGAPGRRGGPRVFCCSSREPLRDDCAVFVERRAARTPKILGSRTSPPPRLPLTIGLISQLPARQAWLLARLWRGPKRSVRGYVSIGPEPKRSQKPGSAGVLNSKR